MTTNPSDLVAVRAYLSQRTGQTFAALGIAGDDAHAAGGGYHIGGNAVPAGDYSRAESPRDRTVTSSDASAFDLGGNFPRFREITVGLVAACKNGDPRARDIREVIYTPDGVNVRRWDRLGVRSGGDSSHLFHTHISFFRDSAGRRAADDNFLGLLKQLFAGTTLEDDMTPEQARRLDAVYEALFFGGDSCGQPATAKVNADSRGNAIVDQLAELRQTPNPVGGAVDPAALATALAGNATFVKNMATAMVEQLPAELGRRLVNG